MNIEFIVIDHPIVCVVFPHMTLAEAKAQALFITGHKGQKLSDWKLITESGSPVPEQITFADIDLAGRKLRLVPTRDGAAA